MPLRLDKEICKTLCEDFANLPNKPQGFTNPVVY